MLDCLKNNKKSLIYVAFLALIAGLCLVTACVLNMKTNKNTNGFAGTNNSHFDVYETIVGSLDYMDSFKAENSETEEEEKENTYFEETDYSNPYALYIETFRGSYLYDIYQANKGSDADGDWFINDSERFTYYEVYYPLNDDKNHYIDWEIELSEMKGTDKLAQAVNKYHVELFEEQKKMMQEKQKKVMAMDVDELGCQWVPYANDIHTMASFEWGNIFIIVDMENIYDRGCRPVIANFNRVTGEKYEFSDLFNTEDCKEKLLEIIRHKLNGYENNWSYDLKSDSFSFMITYNGLSLIEDYPESSILFEWDELEDILSQEIISDVLEHTDWHKSSEGLELTDEVYLYEKEVEKKVDRKIGGHVAIHYPQIKSDAKNHKQTNIIIRDVAFSFFDGLEELTYDEAINLIEEEMKDGFLSVMIEYEVLGFTDEYISVIFSVESSNSFSFYRSHYMATIDLNTNQYIHIFDLMDMEELTKILNDNHFEVFIGTHAFLKEKDVHEQEMIDEFIEILEDETNSPDVNQWYGDVMEHIADNPHYDRFSCQNIGLDEKYLYIRIEYYDALDGYFIFKFPRELIKAITYKDVN